MQMMAQALFGHRLILIRQWGDSLGAFELRDRNATVYLRYSDHMLLRHGWLQNWVLLHELLLVLPIQVKRIEVIAGTGGLVLLLRFLHQFNVLLREVSSCDHRGLRWRRKLWAAANVLSMQTLKQLLSLLERLLEIKLPIHICNSRLILLALVMLSHTRFP